MMINIQLFNHGKSKIEIVSVKLVTISILSCKILSTSQCRGRLSCKFILLSLIFTESGFYKVKLSAILSSLFDDLSGHISCLMKRSVFISIVDVSNGNG